MKRLPMLLVGLLAWGCAQGHLDMESVQRNETCVADSDCLASETCALGYCALACDGDGECGDDGRCVPHSIGTGGWCAQAPAESAGETPMSPGETSESPVGPAPDPGSFGPSPPPPSDDEEDPLANPPPVEAPNSPAQPSPPPAEPEPGPQPEPAPPEPEPDPEPDPEPAPEPAPEPPPPDPVCTYPAGGNSIQLGGILPRLSWATAYDANGDAFPFDLENFHCDPNNDRYSILVVVVGAEWCNACAQYMRDLAPHANAIDAAGGLLLYVETQDSQTNWMTSRQANRVINGYVGNAPGIRVGDGDTRQGAGTVYNAPIVNVLPTVFAVRRSDMRIIEKDAGDWAAVARREQGGAPPGGGPPQDCREEVQEPNNAPAASTLLGAGDTIDGGICDGTADFYRVLHPGQWTLDLAFRHGDGDLDVYVYNPFTDDVLFDGDGAPVGSDSTTDNEQFSFFGEQIVVVLGYEGARAPYRLHLNGH